MIAPATRCAVAGWLLMALASPSAGQSLTPVSASRVLVMPFETETREPRSFWLGEGSAVILTDSLLALGLPAMRRDERVRSFELLRVPAITELSRATMLRVARVIGASQLIVGRVALSEETLTIRARNILVDDTRMQPEIVETGPLSGIFQLYDRVAQRLVPGASTTPDALDASHPPIAGFEQFIKGLLAPSPRAKLPFLSAALRLAPSLQRARVAMWEAYNELGDNQRALAAIRPVPAEHRLGRQARLLASVSLIQMHRYQDAFTTLTALNQERRDAAVLNNLGVVQLRRPGGDPGGRAVPYFNEAASLDELDAFFNLGYAYWLDGDGEAAVRWLREAVRRNTADHAAHYVLAAALDATGNATEAARERELARQLSGTYADWEATAPAGSVPPGLERLRTELGEPSFLRVENIIAAAEQRDQQALAAFHMGEARRAYSAQRDLDAVASLRRVIFLSPYDDQAHLLLARTYLRMGRPADAVSASRISIWSRDTTDAHLVLAEALARSGSLDEARAEARRVLEREPGNTDARRLVDSRTRP